jgi:hypothetical protein
VEGVKANAVIPLADINVPQLADQIFSIVTKTFNMKGTWSYQSFLLLPTDTELAAKPGTSVASRMWASGQLVVLSEIEGELLGELVFAPSVKLNVKGRILLSTDSVPTVFEAIGEGFDGPTKGALYKIIGWIVPTSPDEAEPLNVCGSVLAVRGSDSSPDLELGGMPVGTVGTFVLIPA